MGGNISPFKPFLRYRYPLLILCLKDEIYETMDLIPAHILLDSRKIKQEPQDFYQDLQPEDMSSNPKLLQQIHFDHLAENSEGGANRWRAVHGRLRKKTLALALWNDVPIKAYFQNLLFITVSESPNGKGLLEIMWVGIVGRKRTEFQNLEDAHMQLLQQLLRQSKSTQLILDNVGSRAKLGKLLFHVAGYKTLFTTRDTSIIPRNYSTQFYQLPLLGQEDALSLFIFWASGQMPIPSNGDANLSKRGSSRIFCQGNGIC